MPSGVAPLTILSPETAALAAAKIVGLSTPDVQNKIDEYQEKKRAEIDEADRNIQ
ncbi:MAG: hypothetical protein AB7S54_13230 [Bacteroidales bacterium]